MVGGYLVRASPAKERWYDIRLCQATIRNPQGKLVFRDTDWAISINAATGESISGSGKPEVVFEGYSGGAHCCWTYWIVALGERPRPLRKIYNESLVSFEDLNHDGRIEIVILDGAFDYFDGQSHASSPFPLVILRLQGTKLERVNSEFWPLYEKKITAAEAQLTAHCVEFFRSRGFKSSVDTQGCEPETDKEQILIIVLDYLYGGREKEAWEELARYWQPADLERIRTLILKTARGSFLGDTSNPKYGNR